MDNVLWNLGNAIDAVHMPFYMAFTVVAIVTLALGRFMAYFAMYSLCVGLQAIVKGCPITWLTDELRQFRDPTFNEFDSSSTTEFFSHLDFMGPFNIVLGLGLVILGGYMIAVVLQKEVQKREV